MAIKSLITQVVIDRAGNSHNCQANSKHRIAMGEIRLKVRNGRSWDHYCRACGENIIKRDLAKLTALQGFTPTEKG
ncbi:hypothetical protein GUF92_00890 [Xanthomonas citri pv. citri]|uniref:hypothetical protein n=1 Tax=Xanthomonas TaxID=338 RepID=UPI000A2FB3D3|nr:hypothetical protein [Xanthomonas citri]ARR15351.1 hypothetical protein B7L66_24640 [Xanthomonas citri pv. citri]ARR19980.1 hypothetical protein B7L65_24290 [Xanthomonas citri pv. citri]ARR24737.1 hypothetical protein B7L67_24945 [Xanthomonas citri pv. citri]MBD4835359.1 hypothetical protein [Xanthomonas citri pv. citri]MBD4863818.1 hypothetical protein [Xanthomonas citri pv. citri]